MLQGTELEVRESHGSPLSPSMDGAEAVVTHGCHVQGCHTHSLDTLLGISLREESPPGPKLPSCLSHRVRKLTARKGQKHEAPAAEREPRGPTHTPEG